MSNWSLELHPDVRDAHDIGRALVGTVEVPSPVPAAAIILVGLGAPLDSGAVLATATGHTGLPSGKFYLKVVEIFSHQTIITRFFDLADIRGLKEYLEGDHGEGKIWSARKLKKNLDDAISTLENGQEFEVVLAKKGVVFIHESTRALLRFDHYVPAAVASQSFSPGRGLDIEACSPRCHPS